MPFSGKSEAVEIAKEKNIPVFRMGDTVWEEVERRDLELNDKNVGKVANEMRQAHGKNIWAKKTLEKIKSLNSADVLIIDGIRNSEEIDTFKTELGQDFIVVAITTSDEIRYKRAMNREREDDSQDENLIKKRDERELGWGLGKVIDLADIKISNNKDIESFQHMIKDLLKKYTIE